MYDPDLDTVLICGASQCGLGGVVSQVDHEGNERVVACISRTLSTAEKNYSIGELEALACVWACENFHVFLWGRKFKLRTEHKSLTTSK